MYSTSRPYLLASQTPPLPSPPSLLRRQRLCWRSKWVKKGKEWLKKGKEWRKGVREGREEGKEWLKERKGRREEVKRRSKGYWRSLIFVQSIVTSTVSLIAFQFTNPATLNLTYAADHLSSSYSPARHCTALHCPSTHLPHPTSCFSFCYNSPHPSSLISQPMPCHAMPSIIKSDLCIRFITVLAWGWGEGAEREGRGRGERERDQGMDATLRVSVCDMYIHNKK